MKTIKQRQIEAGFVKKPTRQICSTCEHYRFNSVPVPNVFGGTPYEKREKLHCGMHGWAVKSTSTCNKWQQTFP